MTVRPAFSASVSACVAASVLLLAGCATPAPTPRYDLTPTRTNGQDLAGYDASTILESRQPGGIVSVRANPAFADFGAGFVLGLNNASDQLVRFSPSDISATSGGRKLEVLTAAELDRRAVGATRSFVNATDRTGVVDIDRATADVANEYRFNNYGGCPAGQSGCQIYSADNGRDYRTDRLNREFQAENVADAAVALQMSRQFIATTALKPAALAPGEMAGGAFVVVPPPAGGPIDLTVTFGGKTHSFTFAASPASEG